MAILWYIVGPFPLWKWVVFNSIQVINYWFTQHCALRPLYQQVQTFSPNIWGILDQDVTNTLDSFKTIDYLIEYQFVYEKDILLQNFRAVKLWGFKHFQYWKTMMKKQELAKEYNDIHEWQINKMHSRAKIKHKTMKSKKNSITVNLTKSNSWFNIKAIMIQWVDKEKIQKEIKVSIDVLYA